MKKIEIKSKLQEFYRVSESVLEPDNCSISKRKDKIFVRVDLIGCTYSDQFKIVKNNLIFLKSIRPKGEEQEVLFFPEH